MGQEGDRDSGWTAKLVAAFTEALAKVFPPADAEDLADHGKDETVEDHVAMAKGDLKAHLAAEHAVPKALLGDATHPEMKQYHAPFHVRKAAEAAVTELQTDLVPLVERGIRADGTIPLKVISPGWGASGYYSAAVLERDAAKAFPAGTKMYLDHPTAAEEAARPERSVRDLAAEFTGPARWSANGPAGPGLYADAKVIGPFKEMISDLAPHIGVSIRALGKARQGEAEGRSGRLVEQLITGLSVDFVTQAGAGGKVLQLMESARARADDVTANQEKESADMEKLEEVQRDLADSRSKLARMQEALVLRDAADTARTEVGRTDLPDITKARLVESLAQNPPTKDGEYDRAAHTARITEAVKAERDYVNRLIGSGQIRGMGRSEPTERDYDAELVEAFRDMGHDEATAKALAGGKGN